jgi:hypothetical protein
MRFKSRFSIVAAVVTLALGATGASAQSTNPFAIDGIITDANNSGVAPGATKTIDANASTKELGPINSSATKIGVINTAAPPMLGVTNPNAQVDLNTVYTQSAISGTDLWFYFAWMRDSNSGSGFISIELQKAAPAAACNYSTLTQDQLIAGCNPWAGRQNGDFLILWDQSGSNTQIAYRVFNNGVFGPPITLDPTLAQAVYGTGDTSRGEVAVNISAIVAGQSQQCLSFANIVPGTVTGNSDTADYKDTVLSLFPAATNCGSVVVNKVTQNGQGTPITGTGPFPYTLTAAATPIFGGAVDSDCASATNKNLCLGSLAQGGSSNTISNLLARTNYTLSEGTIPALWKNLSIVCGGVDVTSGGTFAVQAAQTTTCTITNKLVLGHLTVIKQVVNNNGGLASPSDFKMNTGTGGADFPGSSAGTTFDFEDGTAYNVTELGVAGYHATSYSTDCTGTIAAGTTKTCTVINDDIPPVLKLFKVVHNNAGGTMTPANFTLTATGASTITGPGPEVDSGSTFQAGTYALSESSVAGYSVETTWSCTGGTQNGSSITVPIGGSATCTIVNKDSKASPSGGTSQRALLFDKMTVTGIRAGAPDAANARVTFRLFSDNACSVPVGASEAATINAQGVATTVNGVAVTGTGTATYYWTAAYTGDQYNNAFTSNCGSETTTVNFQP